MLRGRGIVAWQLGAGWFLHVDGCLHSDHQPRSGLQCYVLLLP